MIVGENRFSTRRPQSRYALLRAAPAPEGALRPTLAGLRPQIAKDGRSKPTLSFAAAKMADVEKGQAGKAPESEDAPLLGSESSLLGVTATGVRLGFIRKVYGIVLAQLLLTSVIASVMMFVEPVRDYVRQSPGMYFLSFAMAMLAVLILAFSYISICPCYGLYKIYPANYVLLTIFVSPVSPVSPRDALIQALAVADAGRELRRRRDLLLPQPPGRRPRPGRHSRHRHRSDHVCDDGACCGEPHGARKPRPPATHPPPAPDQDRLHRLHGNHALRPGRVHLRRPPHAHPALQPHCGGRASWPAPTRCAPPRAPRGHDRAAPLLPPAAPSPRSTPPSAPSS